jgi:oligoribonuclease NrnB/cAMP/cGMP phosphodiesterase (DHH superfamily)
MYERIITHNDMDGVVSAAICSFVFPIDDIQFAGPNDIIRGQISATEKDIVCDLPYPLRCGLWFDHHEGNALDLRYRNIEVTAIAGRFAPKASCSRVVYEYFFEKGVSLPLHLEDTVEETDIIDSFNYRSVEEWRRETPGMLVDYFLKASSPSVRDKYRSLKEMVTWVRDLPLREVAALPAIKEGIDRYRLEEERMLKLLQADACFLPDDTEKEIIIIDLSRHNRRPQIIKNLAFLLYPQAAAVLEIHPLYDRGIKTTNLGFAISLSFTCNNHEHKKDLGEIMRELSLGDGHRGAAGGTIYATSKVEMLKKKQEVLQGIYKLWISQG